MLAVLGLVLAVAVLAVASQRERDAVAGLARAPVNCTTTLDFDRAGTYVVFVETEGELDQLPGDCPAPGGAFRHAGPGTPSVELRLSRPDGRAVELRTRTGHSYDVEGMRGRSVARVRIDEPGTYQLTVRAEATDVAVAIGRNPARDAVALRVGGIALGVLCLVGGVALIVAGLRRPRPAPGRSPSTPPTSPGPPSWGPPSP